MGGSVSSKDRKLFQAINDNNIEQLQLMLAEDADLPKRPLMGGATTPLCRAVYTDNQDLVLLFLENGADIDGKA